ncbi:HlyD family secretion protein [Clostridium pasteurianum]|uniref:Multidrug resistance efflux pump n=1 Tax=Clostridium pasteurianum BC1 TaxID=86416 RepID=R4K6L7_CLOPA|nr:efflux RND transporter periplasmic adaptor subunit [Clostridium pasteurianum]AGK95290.1 multidrug resistance efflux pump [Clostridium pasteurianum BC1]
MKKLSIVVFMAFSIVLLAACEAANSSSKTDNRYTSTVEAESYNIVSELSGKITDIPITQGSTIKEGDKIASIDSTSYELQQKESEAVLAITKAKQGDLPENASDNVKNSAQASVNQAQAALDLAKLQVDKCTIKSSIGGTVLEVLLHKGEMASPGMNIAKIIDLNNKYIKVYVEESKRNNVSLNENVPIYDDNKKLGEGKITYISPQSEFTPKNTETKDEKQKTVFEVKISLSSIDKVSVGTMVDAEIK